MSAKFEDYSVKVKAALNDTTIAWLHEVANEIAAQANRNCKMDGEAGRTLRGSYGTSVDEKKGSATVGSPQEAVYWEEFGTGEYADTAKNGGKKGRQGWWVYVEGGSGYDGKTNAYKTQKEAEAVAAGMRAEGIPAVATKGRKPAYTLLNSFNTVAPNAVDDLKRRLKEKVGD